MVFLLAIAGCGDQVSPADIEQQIIARAPEFIGPADSCRTEMRGMTANRIDEINIVAIGVKPDPNLVIDPLHLTLQELEFEQRPFAIRRLGNTTFTARISESAVNNFLRQQKRTDSGLIKNIRVQFQQGTTRVTGSISVMMVDIPFETTGGLKVAENMRLEYDEKKMRVVGVGLPDALPSLVTHLVNPLVDLSGLRFTPKITRVTVEPGAVVISGTAVLRGLE
ncbi:MAG: LmeA family phospholipid-binding protein [Armatimonadota bacterium]